LRKNFKSGFTIFWIVEKHAGKNIFFGLLGHIRVNSIGILNYNFLFKETTCLDTGPQSPPHSFKHYLWFQLEMISDVYECLGVTNSCVIVPRIALSINQTCTLVLLTPCLVSFFSSCLFYPGVGQYFFMWIGIGATSWLYLRKDNCWLFCRDLLGTFRTANDTCTMEAF
jgi:hypothetical protein